MLPHTRAYPFTVPGLYPAFTAVRRSTTARFGRLLTRGRTAFIAVARLSFVALHFCGVYCIVRTSVVRRSATVAATCRYPLPVPFTCFDTFSLPSRVGPAHRLRAYLPCALAACPFVLLLYVLPARTSLRVGWTATFTLCLCAHYRCSISHHTRGLYASVIVVYCHYSDLLAVRACCYTFTLMVGVDYRVPCLTVPHLARACTCCHLRCWRAAPFTAMR